ncbi:MAG: ABC transporter permease [Desulfobacterales bacterium]|nr:ABC transporter permease [Desulfobacterales bacterium]
MEPAKREATKRWLGISPAVLVIFIFMVIPICIMAVYAFLEANPYGGVRPHFTLDAFIQFFFEYDFDDNLVFNSAYLNIYWRSFVLAFFTTVLCLLIGFPTAYYIAMQPTNKKNMLIFLVTIPFWTNLLIRTFSWILILRDYGVINNILLGMGVIDKPLTLLYTNGAVLIGLVYTYIPFIVLPIYATVEKLDLRLLEAAHDLYANRRQLMSKIILPLTAPGIIAGGILVFIPSLGAFIAPNLLGGGKKLMIGSLIQLQFASSRNWPFGSAAALFLMAAVLIAMMIYLLGPARKTDLGENAG